MRTRHTMGTAAVCLCRVYRLFGGEAGGYGASISARPSVLFRPTRTDNDSAAAPWGRHRLRLLRAGESLQGKAHDVAVRGPPRDSHHRQRACIHVCRHGRPRQHPRTELLLLPVGFIRPRCGGGHLASGLCELLPALAVRTRRRALLPFGPLQHGSLRGLCGGDM